MALTNEHLNVLISKHSDCMRFKIDQALPSTWYIGFNRYFSAQSSDSNWLIYKLQNSGTDIDVSPAYDLYNNKWDDRASLGYEALKDLTLSTSLYPIAQGIGTVLASIDFSGGTAPYTYDIDHIDYIIENKNLKINSANVAQGIYDIVITVTDAQGDTLINTFSIEAVNQVFLDQYALKLNGIDERVITDINLPNNNISVGTWFKLSAKGSANYLISEYSNTSTNGRPYRFMITTSGNLRVTLEDGTGKLDLRSYEFYLDNTWHYAVFTYTAGDLKLYMDGTLLTPEVVTSTLGGGILEPSSSPTYIGGRDNGSANCEGLLNNLTLWDGLLSAQDILDLYNGGIGDNPTSLSLSANLLNWFKFDNDLSDAIGSANLTPLNFGGDNYEALI